MYRGRKLSMLAMALAVFAGVQTFADPARQPPATKHQMIVRTLDCMRKRMQTDRAVSYNEAAKSCRARVTRQAEKSASDPVTASDN
jgi:hypothetical protein